MVVSAAPIVKLVAIMFVVVLVNIVVVFIAVQLVEHAVMEIAVQQDILVLTASVYLFLQLAQHHHRGHQLQQHHRDQQDHPKQQLLLLFINLIDVMKMLNVLYSMLINGMSA